VTPVALVCPGFAAARGGVTDHTSRLVAHWNARGVSATVLETPGELARVRDPVMVQYVPFLYARRGLAPDLVRAAAAARAGGARVTIFVHEPWVPPTRLPWLLLSPLQRRQLRLLSQRADAVVTPVPAWQPFLSTPSELVYVGSTLGPAPATHAGPSLEAPVVFSPFASGLAWPWILAAEAAIGAGLVVVGATHADAGTRLRLPARAREWQWLGRLPATSALATLARARLVLAPYVDGLTGRRTAALAALSTGVPMVSSHGPLSDPLFADGPATLAGSAAEFAQLAADRWSAADDDPAARTQRRAWFDQHFDARRLDDRLLDVVLGGYQSAGVQGSKRARGTT
jgi:glycosyltransferase involved in cell wall biosynthesis